MKQSSAFIGVTERILFANSDPGAALHTRAILENEDYQVEIASGIDEVAQRLTKDNRPDLLLLDIAIEGGNGLQMLEACRRANPDQKIVVLSSVNHTSTVVQAIQLGAQDYVTAPYEGADLLAAVKKCLAQSQKPSGPANDHGKVEERFEPIENETFFLAASPAMQKIRNQAEHVAKVDIPVLILGESGAGKEVLARLIHKLSVRSRKPMVKVNCAALPHELLESELFGYEPGAFTGATRSKPGMFELCDKGTVMLDEIGEMSPVLQAKLLHVLQDGRFSRLGGRHTISADFRVLAATNINVQEAIGSKTFREDLYYRLNAFTIHVPPLRERREEIPLLFKHFTRQFSEKYDCPPAEYSQELIRACLRYAWPGNLRELGNFVKRFMVLRDEALAIAELEEMDKSAEMAADLDDEDGLITSGAGLKSMVRLLKEKAEPKIIERVLVATKWNCKMAALQLKISYKALLYKMKQYQIFPPGMAGPGLRGAHG